MMPEPTQLRDFAARYTAAWNSRDASSVAAFFAEGGSLSVNGVPSVGRAAITAVAQRFMSSFPDMHLLMNDLISDGGRAVYHWTFIGTNTVPGGTGHKVRFSGYEVWRFGPDGLIAESQGQFDSAEYQRHLEHGADEDR